jgi:hypothetical protein
LSSKLHTMLLDLFYRKNVLVAVGLNYDNNRHVSADIRLFSPIEPYFAISNSTISDKVFNDEMLNELTELGYYEKQSVETEIRIETSFYIHHFYINPSLVSLIKP